jgi:dUTP pyrophosphatase
MKHPRSRVVRVRVVRLAHARDLPLPRYQTAGAAGMDLLAALPANAPVRLKRGARAMIPTGLIVELPAGTEGQVRPRSGLASRHGVTVLNSPGTIDSDYRGEVQVVLINHGDKPFVVQRGDRIAQVVVAAVARAELGVVSVVRKTTRGAGGYGSTGVSGLARQARKTAAKKPAKGARKGKQTRPAKPRPAATFKRRAVRSRASGRR